MALGTLVVLGVITACSPQPPPANSPQAIATRVAPTIIALSGTLTVGAATVAASPILISDVNVSPSDTTVVLMNSSSSPVNMDGWLLFLGPSIQFPLSAFTVDPGKSVTLHVNSGQDTATDVYLGGGASSSGGIALTFAPGQRAVLIAPGEQVAAIYRT